jgi:copper transport protein
MARLSLGMAVLVLPYGLFWLVAEGMDRLGLPLSALPQGKVWVETIRSPVLYTVVLATSAAMFAVAAVLAQLRGCAGGPRAGSPVLPRLGPCPFAPTPLGLPLMALHGGAMLFWIGSLIPLTAALSPLDAPAHADLLRRFSRPALTAGLVWIGSGAGLILIRPLKVDTLSTPWARLPGVRFTLVGVMLALAIWHRARAVPMLARG